MIENRMVIERPKSCHDCGNGWYALGHAIDYAVQQGWDVLELSEEQARQQPVFDALDNFDPLFFYGFGHGNACYSEDTEILTEDGWKLFYELKDEKVATLDKETNELIYQQPTKYVSYFYEGDMFYQKGSAIDLLVTPNHNLFVSWLCAEGKKYKPFMFLKPKDFKNGNKRDKKGRFTISNTTNSRLRFKRDAKWIGKKKKHFTLPAIKKKIKNQYGYESEYIVDEKKLLMNDWLEFFGYWISEGSACLGFADKNKKYINYRISIAQNNDENRETMKRILEKLGYSYRESGNSHSMNLEIRNKQLYLYLKKFGHAKNKFIPKEIKELSPKQLKILFDALILGDGSICSKTNYSYSTSSEQLANDFQEICLKIGYAAIMRKNKNNVYRLHVSTKENLNPLCMKRKRGFIKYNGMVYCVEVPNHLIYVRRNGNPVWCGNSTYTGQGEPPEIIFNTNNCDKLKSRIVYLLSCETGVSLGPAIIEKGALAYAGFILSWYWIVEDDAGTDGDPYLDLYAHGFYESANELWLSVCDGENFTQAIQRSIDKYNEWIDYWFYENPEARYSQDCIMYLASNRDSLIGLYNCEGLDEPLCLTAGCNWEQNQCLQPPMQEPSTGIPILLAISLIAIIGIAFFAVKK